MHNTPAVVSTLFSTEQNSLAAIIYLILFLPKIMSHNSTLTVPASPGKTGMVCRYYAQTGSCFYGEKCNFKHSTAVAVPLARGSAELQPIYSGQQGWFELLAQGWSLCCSSPYLTFTCLAVCALSQYLMVNLTAISRPSRFKKQTTMPEHFEVRNLHVPRQRVRVQSRIGMSDLTLVDRLADRSL